MSSLSAASSSSLLGSGRINVTGLASGLDVDKIIQGLLTIEQRRVEKLQANSSRIESQQAAFKGIEARLLSLQGQLFQLAQPQNGVFDLKKVTSTDETAIKAVAGSSAQAGVYQLKVNQLAQNHQIASQGFEGTNALITQGTFKIGTATGQSVTITIDGTNNTLQGLANAINTAEIGVSAQLVNDGSGSTRQPYRLLLTSARTGTSNSITIENNLGAESGSAVRPTFTQTFHGRANLEPGFTGTSIPESNHGAGSYTGDSNTTFSFTVVNSGTVGVDDLEIGYQDASGSISGTIHLSAADVDTPKSVAQGLEVRFSAGTLVAGQRFTVKAYAPVVQQASDASITLGSGAGAISVSSATNLMDGLFPGISLDLRAADPAKTLTLTVANDTEKPRQAIQEFVDTFNALLGLINDQTKFDVETQAAGVLIGNRQVSGIQDQLRDIVFGSVPGLKSQMNRLSALGITTSDQGRLVLNASRLEDALSGRIQGVRLDDVRRLFSLAGGSPQSGVEFVTASAKTRVAGTPFQVVVSQAATRGEVAATTALAASTVIDANNDALDITIDGISNTSITLTHGIYSRSALIQELQTRLNSNAALAGRGVSIELDAERVVIISNAFGSSSKVAIQSGTALSTLGFTAGQSGQGQDVAGHFMVNGQIEQATGSGQLLLGSSSNENTAELQVRVTLNPAQVIGSTALDFTVTRGIASALDRTLSTILDPINGRMKTINGGFQEQIDNIQQTITRQNASAQQKRDALLKQFVALETTISQLQSLGSYLSQQFAQVSSMRTTR